MTLKRIFRTLLLIIGLLLLVLAIVVAFNWTFITRAIKYPPDLDITTPEYYEPKAKVAGNFTQALPTADSLSISEVALQELTDYVGEQNSTALLVLHKGKLLVEKYWERSTAESFSNSQSMVKTITSLLLGKAIEEGKIGSEMDLASDYLEEWKGDAREKITIQDLLYMQSGLRNEDDAANPMHDLSWMYLGTDVEGATMAIPAEKEAGVLYEYNNANSQLLGIIIERATGIPIEEYASEKLWKPIGAKDAGWWLDRSDGMPKTFCCYFARARDWVRIGKMMLDNGKWEGKQVISESWIEKMLIPSKIERDYGYHLWLGFEDGGRKQKQRKQMFLEAVFTLDGREKQQVYVVPSEELVIVRIGEHPNEWDEGYIANVLIRAIQTEREKSKTTETI